VSHVNWLVARKKTVERSAIPCGAIPFLSRLLRDLTGTTGSNQEDLLSADVLTYS
jgi:hypothetical protein